jgi:hypothetical protein
MKEIYLAIKSKLETDVTELQTIRLFNNQFERSNNDSADFNDEQAFAYPCAFIDFPGDNEQMAEGSGVQYLDVTVRVLIGYESYLLEDLTVFDLKNKVFKALYNLNGAQFTSLSYLAQRIDTNHNNVYIYQLEFKTKYEQCVNFILNDKVEPEYPVSLTLNKNLDIDNNIIRTGDGII